MTSPKIRKDMLKNDQIRNQRKSNRKDSKEGDKYMPRQAQIPKINSVQVTYNGDRNQFDLFIKSIILDYLNSNRSASDSPNSFIDKVEFIPKTA